MYYVYYCGTGLITAIIYGLLVITLPVYCYVEEVIIYASLACISFLFSIIIGSINQIRIKKQKSTFIKLKHRFNDKKVYQFYYVI